MSINKKRTLMSILQFVICLSIARGNLITNGGFEQPEVPYRSDLTYYSGHTFAGWTVKSGSIDVNEWYFDAYEGDQTLDLDGDNPGSIAQIINTNPGYVYELTFQLAGNPDPIGPSSSVIKSLNVHAAGAYTNFTFDVTGHSRYNLGWVEKSWTFTAVAPETEVRFESLSVAGSVGPLLDNVVVELVPEPASLFLLGLGGIFLRKCRGESTMRTCKK